MKKYRIYSGTKPDSADKTFAVNWGGKYFAVSPIASVQSITNSMLTFSDITASGDTLSVTCSDSGDDSLEMVPHEWYCSNENVNSGDEQSFVFSDRTARVFGPKTNMVYSWNAPSGLKPGTNVVQADFMCLPASSYQTGSLERKTNKFTFYRKYAAPKVEITNVTFRNRSWPSWPYNLYTFAADEITYSVKVTNPNEVPAREYRGTTMKGILGAGGSIAHADDVAAFELGHIGEASLSKDSYSTFEYSLDSSVNDKNANTGSPVVTVSKPVPKPPVLVSCMPTSASSDTFQVTVKNSNSSQYYCRVSYNLSGGTASDYWMADCPANGTGTMTSTTGNATTFSFVRGSTYMLTLYFYTLTGTTKSYSGTQVSRTVHYPYKAPDSGFLYASPVVVSKIYNNNAAPTTVTFQIFNANNTTLKTEMDLYKGTGTSGTRVDYWMVSVPSMGYATCPNTWGVSKGSTYTLICYFMNNSSSYHGTPVSGSANYTFTIY